MKETIHNLKKRGFFQNIVIDEKGYGTFRNPNKMPGTNTYIDLARKTKKEADSISKYDKERGIYTYIQAMLLYITGYKSEETSNTEDKNIIHYQGLYKYVKDILRMVNPDSKYKNFLEMSLMAIKVRVIELMAKSQEAGDFLDNVSELAELCKNMINIEILKEEFSKLDMAE